MKLRYAVIVICIFITLVACTPQGHADIAVRGDVNRDLSKTGNFYEEIPAGRQIWIEKIGPGEDICILSIYIKGQIPPGVYNIDDYSLQAPISATYAEFVGGVSYFFESAGNGTLTVEESGQVFSGSFEFDASSHYGDETVQISGTVQGIPYTREGTTPPLSANLALIGILLLFTFLVLLNFGFQFYVGNKVYAGQGMQVLRSLRGTRTFIRGWQASELRDVMIAWSILLIGLLIIFGFLAVVSAGYAA